MELGAHVSTAHELLRVTGYTPDPQQNRPLEEGPMARSQSLTSPSVPQAAGILPSSPPSDRAPPPPDPRHPGRPQAFWGARVSWGRR